LSSVLRSLTASYSSDTVMLLASIGMFFHVLSCDFTYANGLKKKVVVSDDDLNKNNDSRTNKPLQRPPFLGGTFSLNAALFSATLLVSRLDSNAMAYLSMTLAIVVFSFYPETRHAIATTYPSSSSGACIITVIASPKM
jgi:phosphatidylinositol N-acetylglucosaminyltransferase subunit C